MQKAAAAKQALLTAANKRVADQVVAMKPPQAAVGEAKKVNAAAQAQLDGVQKQVDVFKAKTAKPAAKTAAKTAKTG